MAHITATFASIANRPDRVWENIHRANRDHQGSLLGRYGFSNVNRDRHWLGSDMVGIDAGAAVLALDNYLNENRVRRVFHSIPCVQRGLERSGFCSRLAQATRAA
jgi:hypothetical protein